MTTDVIFTRKCELNHALRMAKDNNLEMKLILILNVNVLQMCGATFNFTM